jgi:hypothetical protein
MICLALGSCSPAPRDILVKWRKNLLVVDFPWSFWRAIGRQDRTYCIDRVEVFDSEKMQWVLAMKENYPTSCVEVTMPLIIGQPMRAFDSRGRPQFRSGVTYGVRIDGIGDGLVDFKLTANGEIENETDWDALIEPPCGSRRGSCRGPDGLQPT